MIAAVQAKAEAMLVRCTVAPSADVVVGCSGGADSSVLAHVAVALCRRQRLGSVMLLYIDHGLRRDSAADGQRVLELATELGIPARVANAAVDTAVASLEAAARAARYGVFEGVGHEMGAEILLAHTATDQAETVLMRVIRGTGIPGLAAIPARRGRYVRPLLRVSRREIEAYAEAAGLRAVEDPMNQDMRFFRNRVRHRLMPQLALENPLVEDALCGLAEAAREQRDVLDSDAQDLLRCSSYGVPGGTEIDIAALVIASDCVAKRALSLALSRVSSRQSGRVHLKALLELVRAPPAGCRGLDLPGVRVEREFGRLRMSRSDARLAHEQTELVVSGPDGPYVTRCWRAGDRMAPERLRGHSRKLSDLFAQANVPVRLRKFTRIVVRSSDGRIVWAEHVGHAYGCSARVTLTTRATMASNKC